MPIYTDQMFNATATATTLTQLNAGITAVANPYQPPANGTLLRVIIVMAGQAASSLMEALRVDLNCITFIPNTMRFAAAAGGLRTAPAIPIQPQAFDVQQPVLSSQGVLGSYLFNVAAVTPNVQVLGVFSTP